MEIPKEAEELRGKDLSPVVVERATKPKKTWFFKRLGDGKVFACELREAWQICYNRSSWRRKDFQILGTSDGTTFKRIIDASIKDAQRLQPEIDKQRATWQRYMKMEEDLIFNDLIDMDGDPADEENERGKQKVIKLRTIIEKEGKKLDDLEDEFRRKVSEVVTYATDEEMKVAIENQKRRLAEGKDFDWPPETANINTPKANARARKKIVGLVEQRAE